MSDILPRPIAEILKHIGNGQITSQKVVGEAMEKIEDAGGEGKRTFTKVYDRQARSAAGLADVLLSMGQTFPPLTGLPISVKDLFDVMGDTTTAGSVVRADAAPAINDAPAIDRIRRAGGVLVGRTNMTEFAYSGLGINPHYGTPANPWDRASRRIPGGSSSGAAVSVSDGMAAAAIGTDTGGSVRIPAALCGLTGFKPTSGRVPTSGVTPLSRTLDSVGPIAPTVACCALIDGVMAGDSPGKLLPEEVGGLRFIIPETLVLDDMDETVAAAFQAAVTTLTDAGATITEVPFTELAEIAELNAGGGIPAYESFQIYSKLLESDGDRMDPRIAARMRRGADISEADFGRIVEARAGLISRIADVTRDYDAVLMPTVPVIAPPIADLEQDEALYNAANLLMLRNPSIANFLNRCALTIPCHQAGDAPVGLTLMGMTDGDQRLLTIGAAVERALHI